MQAKGAHASTARNDLSEMSAIWKTGIANGLVGAHGNPFAGNSPPKAKTKKQHRHAFTDAEAARIVEAARDQAGALRWLPIVLCLTGARLNEVCQSTRDDLMTVDGVTVLRLHVPSRPNRMVGVSPVAVLNRVTSAAVLSKQRTLRPVW